MLDAQRIVAAASDRMVVIADDTKWVGTLGRFPLPIEVIPFGLAATRRALTEAFRAAGAAGELALRGRDELLHLLRLGGFPEPYFGRSEREARRWSGVSRRPAVRSRRTISRAGVGTAPASTIRACNSAGTS